MGLAESKKCVWFSKYLYRSSFSSPSSLLIRLGSGLMSFAHPFMAQLTTALTEAFCCERRFVPVLLFLIALKGEYFCSEGVVLVTGWSDGQCCLLSVIFQTEGMRSCVSVMPWAVTVFCLCKQLLDDDEVAIIL